MLSPVMADTRTLNFVTGWNMFSLPLDINIGAGEIATRCQVASYIWRYNQNNAQYEKVQTLQGGLGYWVKLKSPCSVTLNGNSLQTNERTYVDGWNQIGANSQNVNFGDISAGCTITSGPWSYNPSTESYEETTSIEPGYGYLVRVSGDCGSEEPEPDCGDTTCDVASGECDSCPDDCTFTECCGPDPNCNFAMGEDDDNCSSDCDSCDPCGVDKCKAACSGACPFGEGDCESGSGECQSGLICGQDIGPDFGCNGYDGTIDICVECTDDGHCSSSEICCLDSEITGGDCLSSEKYTCFSSSCSCTGWTAGSCGGSCNSNERRYTRTCTPTGCTPADGLGTSRCEPDISCSGGTISGPFIGLSGYPTSTSWLDQIIQVMSTNGMNVYRMSANPEWFSDKPHQYNSNFVQHFLDNTPSDWVIIVDRNHIYPPNETGASLFRTNIATAKNSILEVCNAWPNNPRVWIELANEYVSTDFNSIFQGLIDDVRGAGCYNTLVIDKWNTGWSTADFDDSEDAVYTGMHFYFGSKSDPGWSPSGAETQMNYAIDRNLKVINTEVGADAYEASYFSASEVQELNDFLQWSVDNGISNAIWMNENLDNWNTYQNLGLVVPEIQETTPDYPVLLNNKLSLGFQLDGRDISQFVSSSTLRNLAEEGNFKVVRFFHHRYAHYPQGSVFYPVTNWNNTRMDGTFNWAETDDLINKIIGIGTKPHVVLMYKGTGSASVPSGMQMWSVDSVLPDPNQYAAYCVKWVERYGTTIEYEIANEMMQHYYWNSPTLISRYYTWWHTIASAMRSENPNIKIGDESPTEGMLDKFVSQGETLDFVSFHKYDSGGGYSATDSELFSRAENDYFNPVYGSNAVYSVSEIRNVMGNSNFQVECDEANINWDFDPSDSRIQTMTAAVWAGLSIRYQAMHGLNYWLWWDLAGRASSQTKFGMINLDNYKPWYPYYVLKWFQTNSAVGDPIVDITVSTNSDVRTLSWIHGSTLNIMLIHKSTTSRSISLGGVTGQFSYQKIDDPSGTTYNDPVVKTGTVNGGGSITLNGYTVMLLQQPV